MAANGQTTFADRAKARGVKVSDQSEWEIGGDTFAERAKEKGGNKKVAKSTPAKKSKSDDDKGDD